MAVRKVALSAVKVMNCQPQQPFSSNLCIWSFQFPKTIPGRVLTDIEIPWLTTNLRRLPRKLCVFPRNPADGVIEALSRKPPGAFHTVLHNPAKHIADLVGRNANRKVILLHPFPRRVKFERAAACPPPHVRSISNSPPPPPPKKAGREQQKGRDSVY